MTRRRILSSTALCVLADPLRTLVPSVFGSAQVAGRPAVRDTAVLRAAGRQLVPRRWWEKVPALIRISLRERRNRPGLPIKDPAALSATLKKLHAQGFGAIEVFAPAQGRPGFGGLAAVNHHSIDPELGSMDDFRRLVQMTHKEGMAIITFDQFGYCSVEAPHFLKACDDVRAGRDSKEARWFLWSNQADAPPPTRGDAYFLIRPKHLPGAKPGELYDSVKGEFWQFNERAGRFYWTKWGGGSGANAVRYPQYNWERPEWPEEAERIVRSWMDTGIDGMIIDAVNWFPGCTWEKNRQRMTQVIASYGNTYSQPEGAGGFHEDPVAWISEGRWASVQDFGFGVWWERANKFILMEAVTTGDPSAIETALQGYHDRVVTAGGVLYYSPDVLPRFPEPGKQHLVVATASFIGDLVAFEHGRGLEMDDEITRIFQAKAAHPALQQTSTRRQLPTNANNKYYAMLRTAADRSERVLVVLNFQSSAQQVEVDLSGVATLGLTDLQDNSPRPRETPFRVELPAFGYKIYGVKPAPEPR